MIGSPASEQEVLIHIFNPNRLYMYIYIFQITALRNTIHLLKDELWQLKMTRTSSDLAKLQTPIKDPKTSEIADIYKSSTLLLNVC